MSKSQFYTRKKIKKVYKEQRRKSSTFLSETDSASAEAGVKAWAELGERFEIKDEEILLFN